MNKKVLKQRNWRRFKKRHRREQEWKWQSHTSTLT